MTILPTTEKQGGPVEKGDWQKDMARRRYQKGSIRKRGKRNPTWELQWWEDYIRDNGSIGRRRKSVTLGLVSEMTLRQAKKLAEDRLRALNQGIVTPQSTMRLQTSWNGTLSRCSFRPSSHPPGTLPPNAKRTPLTCLWGLSPLRDRDHRPATICVAENGKRSGMGIRQPLSQSDVEGLRDGKKMELLLWEQSREWGFTSRENRSSGKTRTAAGTDSTPVGPTERAGPHDGALGHPDRNANRRDLGFAPKGREFLFWPDLDRTSLLSGRAWLTQRPKAANAFFPCRKAS